MGNEELAAKNPLRALGLKNDGTDERRSMGLVMARAGLGKTAILVQFALDCMIMGNKVLHVSIGENVDKTRSWYDDLLSRMTDGEKVSNIPEIMRKRMIMTFKESTFTNSKFEERLDDLVKQDIFTPDCLIIDGYDFENSDAASLQEFKEFMKKQGLKMVWFSATSHRGDDRKSAEGIPAPCHNVDGLFENVLLIKPLEDVINLEIVKCDSCGVQPGSSLVLDPSTMLIQKG